MSIRVRTMTQMMDWFRDLCNQWKSESFWKCPLCKALVENEDSGHHVEWHRENGADF